ncbi:hypothetical protein AMAG_20503 [Allomyces macrogynus ATCC 38327]|uniref:Uncharacterized protein n=1 Tax=Allomyces macrogynus (strain ATCC 38327) TaxID=578462 RepID=A0A0L0TDE2_ALLM3|nr:hypothetical protein AMAG_20503 [Allomyces macrogynus ATCC 38327]|eukprot:KNE72690.1 hypothetical protein AMAG_20503 [Allomyces macrogynus ATCC 38327]
MVKNKFKSTLPALPFDPKSLQYPFPPDLLAKYHLSSLEKYAQYALPFPEVPVDLLNMGILDADNFESVPRRRPTTYPVDPKDDPLLFAVIQSSFAATQSRVQLGPGLLRHPTKPGVVAASITPVIPDLRLWPQFYAHVSTEEQIEVRPSEPGHVREPVLRAEQAGDDGRPILDLYVPRAGDADGALRDGVAMYSAIRTRIMLGKSRAARSGTDMARKPPLMLVEAPETEESLQRAEDQYGTIGIDEVLVQKIRELPIDVPWTQALERLEA